MSKTTLWNAPVEYRVDFKINGTQGGLCRYFQGYSSDDIVDMFKSALQIDDIRKDSIESFQILKYNRFNDSWEIQKSKDLN